jgi:hypothetical protein
MAPREVASNIRQALPLAPPLAVTAPPFAAAAPFAVRTASGLASSCCVGRESAVSERQRAYNRSK